MLGNCTRAERYCSELHHTVCEGSANHTDDRWNPSPNQETAPLAPGCFVQSASKVSVFLHFLVPFLWDIYLTDARIKPNRCQKRPICCVGFKYFNRNNSFLWLRPTSAWIPAACPPSFNPLSRRQSIYLHEANRTVRDLRGAALNNSAGGPFFPLSSLLISKKPPH